MLIRQLHFMLPQLRRRDQWKLIKADGIVHTIAGKVSSHAGYS